MDKKDLKWYETPALELVETELEGQILTASGGEDVNEDEEEL